MRCCLIIGHTQDAPGAVNEAAQLTEFEFNDNLARAIDARVKKVDLIRVHRDRPNGLSQLPDKVNRLSPDFIISLHANAFNRDASGTETLYWYASEKGRDLAQCVQNHVLIALGLPDRGIKPRRPSDRGGFLLQRTAAPCVIAEPFFIDSDHDLGRARSRFNELSIAFATAIEEYGQ